MRRSECQAAKLHPQNTRTRQTVLHPPKPVLVDASDLTRTLLWPKGQDAIELQTTDLTELLELAEDDLLAELIDDDLLIEDLEDELVLLTDDELDPPTEDIADFLAEVRQPQHRELSPDESQKRPRLRRSLIAMPPSNTNARGPIDREEPTRASRPRGPMPSLPRFPLLPAAPKPKAVAALPSFPLLPPEPRQPRPIAPPVRLPRF
jgi:hypothetical protein